MEIDCEKPTNKKENQNDLRISIKQIEQVILIQKKISELMQNPVIKKQLSS